MSAAPPRPRPPPASPARHKAQQEALVDEALTAREGPLTDGIEIRVPTLGESVTEATVATWFKKVGDAVAVDEMLCELETDKVTVEVPATAAGVLAEIVAPEGETVGVDALLAHDRRRPAARPQPPAETTKAAEAAAADAGDDCQR